MSFTFRFISLLYRLTIDRRTLEPRKAFFWLLYYGIGLFASLIVISMILICLEAYDLNFARDFLYRYLGQPVFSFLESLLF